jgi:[ribosomal protein S5]-alanine N-acetyltransferase
MTPLPPPILTFPHCLIRPYHQSDAIPMQRLANSPNISRYMRNLFPFPYTAADAESWLQIATVPHPDLATLPFRNFAICLPDNQYCGGIGLKILGDVESRTLEIGYWIGEPYWGQGITTEAVAGFSRYVFENMPDLLRLEAGVFGGNEASRRVLTKAGYIYEGARRKAGCKNGRVFDIFLYGLLREDCLGG